MLISIKYIIHIKYFNKLKKQIKNNPHGDDWEKANDNEEINLLINDFFFYTRLKFPNVMEKIPLG